MKRPLGAQISHMLKDRGVDTIFGIPGVHNVEMYRGIEEAGITHVLARHEQGAGFMADGYARATGKPGVAYVITGPGLCNIMTPMGQAYSDSVPMLVISSCLDEVAAKKGQLHQMKDQRAAAETVCDWSEEAKTAEAAYQLVDRAFGEFASARPRSKHIQLSIEVLGTLADKFPATPVGRTLPELPVVERTAVTALVPVLANSQKPLLVLGGGVIRNTEAKNIVARVLNRTNAAVVTTYAGRGLVDPDYPLDFGAFLAKEEMEETIGQADFVIVVGSELAEVDMWRDKLGSEGFRVRVDIDQEILSSDTEASARLCGDGVDFLMTLEEELIGFDDNSIETLWNKDEIARAKRGWRAETDADRAGIVPIADALREVVGDEVRIYSDMTQFAYVAKEIWPMNRPNLWHHPYGFGTLGYALPAAIGGKIGVGDAPVIAIAGDYGFQYTVQELGVAVELGLSLPIILWDNGKLKEIEDCMVNSQIAPNAVQALNPDFCKLAEAWGAHSAHPKTLVEMQDAVKAAFDASGPTLIYVTPDIL
ncbi:thiamine pyrophosphate-binding protein [Amylibacter sp.]|jgi:5-guanidino-2-oxopentanoate decarboxylase|nr:thiamine pyrophosphate-binding protein [Amylibacter sp.]